VLYDLIEQLMLWGNELPSFWPMMIGCLVLGFVSTLIHELGHGIAAALIAKEPVKIEVNIVGGLCRLDEDSRISLGGYMLVVAAGPVASWLQGFVAAWLTGMADRGTFAHGTLAIMAFLGFAGGIINLVPMKVDDLHTDGKQLVDLTRWAVSGRVPAWAQLPAPPPDPRAATSVAPPG